jgi:multidrug resistance efflux pump
MNEEQLRIHIQEINRGLVALTQLPTTNRLHELLTAQQSAKDAEAQISASLMELALTQQRLKEMEGKTPECSHGDLEEKIRDLERQLGKRIPDQAELVEELEDAQAQPEIMRASVNEYQEQVTQILKLTEGRISGGGDPAEREEQGSEIARISEEDRKELTG